MQTRTCPNCGKDVPFDAISCKFCGALLFKDDSLSRGFDQRGQTNTVPYERPAEKKITPERKPPEPAPSKAWSVSDEPKEQERPSGTLEPFDLSRIQRKSFAPEPDEPDPFDLGKVKEVPQPDDAEEEYGDYGYDEEQYDEYYGDDYGYIDDDEAEELAAARYRKLVIAVLSVIFLLLVALVVLLVISRDELAGITGSEKKTKTDSTALTTKEEVSLPDAIVTEKTTNSKKDAVTDTESDEDTSEEESEEDSSSDEDSSSEEDSSSDEDASLPEDIIPDETEEPQPDPPETEPPQTEPPQTDPPQTDPPQTDPPQTDPPQTEPPQTDPPQTDPPETTPSEFDPGTPDG